jgi:hypothetical protein
MWATASSSCTTNSKSIYLEQIPSHHPVAFLKGFNWRGGSSATVRLLGSRPSSITANYWPEIIESTREAVLGFLSNEANLNYAFRTDRSTPLTASIF